MSPRAACRLEQLGFGEVYDYVGGKMAWVGMGLPTEGSMPERDRVGSLVRADVATCTVDDRCGEVDLGSGAIAVVLSGDVVVGLLRDNDAAARPDSPVGDVMRPGPSTFRPSMPVSEGLEYVRKHDLDRLLITRLDGTWMGLVTRTALEERAG